MHTILYGARLSCREAKYLSCWLLRAECKRVCLKDLILFCKLGDVLILVLEPERDLERVIKSRFFYILVYEAFFWRLRTDCGLWFGPL